ncbi:MAG: sugar ABC transporter substrate-binding protein [Anaerolineae bacterium]|nr:sugar ABC transporter substrate-binding protein [Anaerolineae bacterium]MDW8172685.1 sugar ABC transporter substrate-binding protein [Anaerolineae bacterium]
MSSKKLSRRDMLKIMSAFAASLGLTPIMKLYAQSAEATPETTPDPDVSTAEELELTEEEIEKIKALALTFGFAMNHRTDDFINTVIVGGEAAAKEYGITLLVNEANFDAAVQLAQVENLIQQNVDGIFMIAVDGDSISQAILKANEANIPVIVVGGPPARGQILSLMNSTSYEGCYESCKFLVDAVGGEGKIGVIHIPLALETIVERERGTRDAIAESNMRLVAFESVLSQDDALAAAENMIQANPDLKAIFATWSLAINGALAAIEASGLDIKLSGYDAEVAGFQALHEGSPILLSLAGQQAALQGRTGINGLCKAILGQEVKSKISVPTLLVTAENYKERWEELYPGVTPPWGA